MNINTQTSNKAKAIKLKNYQQFIDSLNTTPEEELKEKIRASKEYIEYIKVHDKEAYENYLSYSTYYKLNGTYI